MNRQQQQGQQQRQHDPDQQRRLLRSVGSLSAVTLLSRILGLVREQIRAHYLGTSMASDAFGIASQIPDLLRRMFAEGAMSAGFVPVLSERRQAEGDAAAFVTARRFTNLLLLVVLVISAFGVIGAGGVVMLFALVAGKPIAPEARALTVTLTRLMFPYLAFIALAAAAQGILNTFRIFWVSAVAPVLLNVVIIAAALTLGTRLDQAAYAFAIGVLIGGLVQVLFQVPFVYRLGFRWRPDFTFGPEVRQTVLLLGPTTVGAGAYQINVMVSQGVAWGLGEGAVSALQYSGRLVELTLGLFAVALSTVILPTLAAEATARHLQAVRETLRLAVRMTCFICVPATAGMLMLRTETVALLFERGDFSAASTSMTSYALGFHVAGLAFIALARVLTPAFYAFGDAWLPLGATGLSLVCNVVLCYWLAEPLAHGGIALANTCAALVHMLALAALLRRHLTLDLDRTTAWSLALTATATAVMTGAVLGARPLLVGHGLEGHGTELLPPYALLVGVGVLTYGLTARLLRHPDLSALLAALRRARPLPPPP